MYKHILIPTDGSELSARAIKQGVGFAKEINAKVTGIYVAPHFFHLVDYYSDIDAKSIEKYERAAKEQGQKFIAALENTAKAADVPCEGVIVTGEQPYEAIIEAAQSKGCDLIFMASHGRRGIKGLVLGSETLKVLTHCKIPVLVCR